MDYTYLYIHDPFGPYYWIIHFFRHFFGWFCGNDLPDITQQNGQPNWPSCVQAFAKMVNWYQPVVFYRWIWSMDIMYMPYDQYGILLSIWWWIVIHHVFALRNHMAMEILWGLAHWTIEPLNHWAGFSRSHLIFFDSKSRSVLWFAKRVASGTTLQESGQMSTTCETWGWLTAIVYDALWKNW